jgi:uncharacterized tellurite resistance protein B-like protein
MFESFRKFLPEVSEGRKHPPHFEHNDYRLAAAALLIHTAAIDGNMSDLERGELHAVVKRQFGLDEATTDELVAEATKAEHEAVDLYHFTSLINRSLNEDGRRRIVEMMWEDHLCRRPRHRIRKQPDVAGGGPAWRFLARAHRAWPACRQPARDRPDVTDAPSKTAMPFEGFLGQMRNPSNDMPAYAAQVMPDQAVADIYAYMQSLPGPRNAKDIEILKD